MAQAVAVRCSIREFGPVAVASVLSAILSQVWPWERARCWIFNKLCGVRKESTVHTLKRCHGISQGSSSKAWLMLSGP